MTFDLSGLYQPLIDDLQTQLFYSGLFRFLYCYFFLVVGKMMTWHVSQKSRVEKLGAKGDNGREDGERVEPFPTFPQAAPGSRGKLGIHDPRMLEETGSPLNDSLCSADSAFDLT